MPRENYSLYNKLLSGKGSKDDQIADLQILLINEKEQRDVERFCWMLGVIILLDIIFVVSVDGWATFSIAFIFVLELALLIILARKWGVEGFTGIIDKYMDWMSRKK